MVGRQYHILGCLNHRARGIWITCINFWHIVCITSWFQGTHNMFGFYTAFVVNVIKCRSKYKKYSKRIPTSKTGKMRQIPGQGQYWQQKLSFLVFFHPKPLDSPSFCLFLHLNQNIDSLYFEAYRFLKVLWRKILCKFTSRHWQAAWQDACRWNFQTYQQDMLLFAHLDTLGFNWIEEETSYFVLDSISTIAILGF